MLPRIVFTQRNSGRSTAAFPPLVTIGSCTQPAAVTPLKQASPSESTCVSELRCPNCGGGQQSLSAVGERGPALPWRDNRARAAGLMAGTKRGRFFDTLERRVRKRRCRRCGRKFTPDPGKRRGDLSALPARDGGGRPVAENALGRACVPPRRLPSDRGVTVRRRNPGFALDAALTGVSPPSRECPRRGHCGMFRHEPRGACVRRSGGLARRLRHQTGCGCNQAQTIGGEAVAGAPGFRHRAGACESHSQGPRRSAGGDDRAHPVFHPSNGEAGLGYLPHTRNRPSRMESASSASIEGPHVRLVATQLPR